MSGRTRGWVRAVGGLRVILVVAVALGMRGIPPASGSAPLPVETRGAILRLGFTAAMFVSANEADAKAALKVWASSVGRERDIPADPEPRVYPGTDAVIKALERDDLDAVALTVEQYGLLRELQVFDRVLAAVRHADPTEEYVVVVRSNAPVHSLADLAGKRLNVLRSPRMGVAKYWLDCELVRAGLHVTGEHFGNLTEAQKLSKVVLPVFFGGTDACLVNRVGLDTMIELNPQLGRDLRIVAKSPPYVPGGFFFRKSFSSVLKEKCIAEFGRIDMSPAGQQILTIFQSPGIQEVHLRDLEPALALLEEHRRMCPEVHTEMMAALRHP